MTSIENLKYIIAKVNKIFAREYNCASFSYLDSNKLLQLVIDLMVHLGILEENNPKNIPYEILTALQSIKYTCKTSPTDFRNGLAGGNPKIIYPILQFLLENPEQLKTRNYLSKYANEIEIPNEILAEPHVKNIHTSYKRLMAQFWEMYSENKQEKTYADQTAELETDLFQMKTDITNITKHLKQQKNKLDNKSATDIFITTTKSYCNEIKRNESLENQLVTDKKHLGEITENYKQLTRRDQITSLPDFIERCEYHKSSLDMMRSVLQDCESELESYKATYEGVEPPENELNELRGGLLVVQKTIAQLEKEDWRDDKMEMFMNQCKAVGKKKERLSKQIMKIKLYNEEILMKIEKICAVLGGDVFRGRRFKDYIAELREMSCVYKQRKKFCNGLERECEVLENTLVLLYKNNVEMKEQMDVDKACDFVFGNDKERKKMMQDILKKYETIVAEFRNVKPQYDGIKTSFCRATEEFVVKKDAFELVNSDVIGEVDGLVKEVAELELIAKLEEDSLVEVEDETEYYTELLLKYSGGMIEGADDVPYVEQFEDQLKVLEARKVELKEQLNSLQEVINKEKEGIESVKCLKEMVLLKINMNVLE